MNKILKLWEPIGTLHYIVLGCCCGTETRLLNNMPKMNLYSYIFIRERLITINTTRKFKTTCYFSISNGWVHIPTVWRRYNNVNQLIITRAEIRIWFFFSLFDLPVLSYTISLKKRFLSYPSDDVLSHLTVNLIYI